MLYVGGEFPRGKSKTGRKIKYPCQSMTLLLSPTARIKGERKGEVRRVEKSPAKNQAILFLHEAQKKMASKRG